MNKERAKEIRNQLKTEFPDIKFSVRIERWRSIHISIMSAPEKYDFQNVNNSSINEFYLERQFQNEALDIMTRVKEIGNKGNTYWETADYGTQPSFYVHLSIGRWDKKFINFMTTEELQKEKEAVL